MADKVQELVTWCRTQSVIPARHTPAFTQLCDLVAQRTQAEIKAMWKEIREDTRAVRGWYFLIAGTQSWDTVELLLRWTVVRSLCDEERKFYLDDIKEQFCTNENTRAELWRQQNALAAREQQLSLAAAQSMGELTWLEAERLRLWAKVDDLTAELERLRPIEREHEAFVTALARATGATSHA